MPLDFKTLVSVIKITLKFTVHCSFVIHSRGKLNTAHRILRTKRGNHQTLGN